MNLSSIEIHGLLHHSGRLWKLIIEVVPYIFLPIQILVAFVVRQSLGYSNGFFWFTTIRWRLGF
jgi:hypothetical protein